MYEINSDMIFFMCHSVFQKLICFHFQPILIPNIYLYLMEFPQNLLIQSEKLTTPKVLMI